MKRRHSASFRSIIDKLLFTKWYVKIRKHRADTDAHTDPVVDPSLFGANSKAVYHAVITVWAVTFTTLVVLFATLGYGLIGTVTGFDPLRCESHISTVAPGCCLSLRYLRFSIRCPQFLL